MNEQNNDEQTSESGILAEPRLQPEEILPAAPESSGEKTDDVPESAPSDTSLPEDAENGVPENPESPEPPTFEPGPSGQAPANDAPVALEAQIAALAENVNSVRHGVDVLQKALTGFYTQTTDSMHKELEKYRKGLVRKLEQELFGELADLYDATDRAISRVAEDPSRARTLLEGLRDQIDAALFNRGVEKREAENGEKFDGRRHHVVRPDVPTGDASRDGTVAATVKPGFDDMDESFKDLRGGCMNLRPIHVRLYKFDPTLATPEPEETTGVPETEQSPKSAEPPVSGDATHPDADPQS